MDKVCRACGASAIDVAARGLRWRVLFQEYICSRCETWYQMVLRWRHCG